MAKVDNKDRAICLVEGDSGSGKSFFMACLKNAVIYDTDLGGGLSDYEDRIKENGSERVEVSSFAEILADIRQRLRSGTLRETIVIDHVTGLHQEALLRYNPSQDSDYGRSNNKATYDWRQIREFARTFDSNLFCVAHMKTEYDKDKNVGKIADGAKNIEADMHIVLKLESLKDDKGRKRHPATAHVIKWRRDPDFDERGPVPESFKFTLEEFEKIHARNYKRERAQVVLAKPESIESLNKIMALLDKEKASDLLGKWLKAATVESLEYMTEAQIQKCTEMVKNLIQGVK
jgi:hypothetical protein